MNEYLIIAGIALVIVVVYHFLVHKKPAPVQSSQPTALEVIRKCVQDEGEKVRTVVAEKHTEAMNAVKAIHTRMDEAKKPEAK